MHFLNVYNEKQKLPKRAIDKIIDGSGKGKPTWIIVPKGYLDEKDFTKYSMQSARKEQIYIWDEDLNTMKIANIYDVAKGWFYDRCEVVKRRLNSRIDTLNQLNHRIDLIKIFAENKMQEWESEDIYKYFINLAEDEKSGTEDANLVLSQPARIFLPENLDKNTIQKEKNDKEIKSIKKDIKNIGDFIINEAKEIIKAQEKFFAGK